jgi:DUF1680 family protein
MEPIDFETCNMGHASAAPESARNAPLYQEVPDQTSHETEITLIPYFAWANRGASEMSVWLPLAS